MCSADAPGALSREDRTTLLDVASESIHCGLDRNQPLVPDPSGYPPLLTVPRATFVTLHLDRELRGCIGRLEALRPLIQDVAHNAYAAAFADPRFAPVRTHEMERITIDISILSPAEPISAASQTDLIRQLRPGVDGLIVAEGLQRGTFLPSVWDSLPRPEEFLGRLNRKAGLPVDYWSDTVKFWRYTAESINRAR